MKLIYPLLIAGALAACSDSNGRQPQSLASVETTAPVVVQDRFRVVESQLDHGGTLSALFAALDRRDLTIFAVVDHAAGASNAGMELDPSTLIIFGNPRAGTPLIQSEPLMGIELPLKALVYDRNGQTFLAITGMGFLEREYGLESRTDLIDQISQTVSSIAQEATRP